jgi:uncharacterized protein involved in exopolysaccharide biosynthesis
MSGNEREFSSRLDVFALWELLWSGRWLVIGISSGFVAIGVAYALLATEKFRAEVVLTAAGQRSMPGALNQLGGLAALAGVTIGSNSVAVPVAVLESDGLARQFIEEMKIEDVLLGDDPPDDADIRDAILVFSRDVRRVYEDRRTGLVTLTIEWHDPLVAAQWANQLVARLNERMRRQALEEAERNVAYLRREMSSSDVVSQQQSIGRVLEAEMQKLVLARGNEEFALRIVDRATPPKQRFSPKRTVTVLLAGILGFISSVVFLLGRRAFQARIGPDR